MHQFVRRTARAAAAASLAALLASAACPASAGAFTPYTTYYEDGYGKPAQIQPAYKPAGVVGRGPASEEAAKPETAGAETAPAFPSAGLNQPQDLFVDGRDHLYIADTGNNRIVHLDDAGRLVAVLEPKESPLSRPSGLFVDKDGAVYVADTGNGRVAKLDASGKLLREYRRPETSQLPASFKYEPTKLVVDKRGFLYIVTLGAVEGLLQLDPDGRFQRFFGSNKVAFSLFDSFKRLVYTREMYRRELAKLPGATVNAAIDRDGFVYTVTKDIKTDQVKKLNIAGLNQLESRGEFASAKRDSFGEAGWWADRQTPPQLQDIAVDPDGNMSVVDAVTGTISQYDANGSLLFYWGGPEIAATSKLGVVKSAAAIAATSKGELLVLDGANGLVQAFRPTEFGSLVHRASKLTREGRYAESEPLWREAVRLDAYYTPALIGLAKAAYNGERYKEAQALFFRAGVREGYSDAFWQTRLVWFQRHFAPLMNAAAAALLVLFLADRLTRRSPFRERVRRRLRDRSGFAGQLRHAGDLLRHPIDGFRAIRHDGKAGLASSALALGLALASFSFMKAETGFAFNPAVYTGVKLGPLLAQFVAVWTGWVVSNFLVSSLMRGEGRLRDVCFGSAYALLPLIVVGVPLTLLSRAFTLSEQAIFGFAQIALIGWTALFFFWMVQGIQNYSVGEAALNIAFSLLAFAALGILLFTFVSLSGELAGFVYSLYQEVVIR
ncbi:SMP-30/gluconolactonase/LRE family protein [Paenibacillus sp. GYB003]|uniref:SMP-30/gluconolactonase/LRE family protein n=1 Tax=Paenibacillus sp. GYB003 TaxID=2994392 RepID=UPI002F969324